MVHASCRCNRHIVPIMPNKAETPEVDTVKRDQKQKQQKRNCNLNDLELDESGKKNHTNHT